MSAMTLTEKTSRFMCRKLGIDPDANDWFPPASGLMDGDPVIYGVPAALCANWQRMAILVDAVMQMRDEFLREHGWLRKRKKEARD